MRVLIGCEFSGVVRDAFTARGHYAVSCDLLPTESAPGMHYQGDVRDIIDDGWDLGIFHPPCTYLSNSGVRWLHTQEGRWALMEEGARFFKQCLDAPIDRVAVENPIMHKYAVEIIGRRQDQVVQPWQHGEGETKGIGLWLRNLPPLEPTDIVEGRKPRIHWMSPSKDRQKLRSTMYKGVAAAMADQWSNLDV